MFGGPKRFYADPSIAIAALGLTPEKLLSEIQVFGGIFEGLCLRDLLVYANSHDAKVFHYRDNSLLEVDAIIERRDGSWSAFEIKLNNKLVGEGAANLLALKAKLGKQGGKPPECMVVLTGTGIAMKRDDGVYVIPITMLKD
jgi:predicted AAA+ superfamily ATPase